MKTRAVKSFLYLFVALCCIASAHDAAAQTNPLKFENNYFVTGDYVVGGWANKQISPNRPGYAIGTISIPDTVQAQATGVPLPHNCSNPQIPCVPTGADVVAAFLYWTTVETQSALEGKDAFFRGYAIQGTVLGNPNAPVSWSSGGCSGDAQGSKTMRVYRADVRPYLPVDSNGIVQPNTSYAVELRDSGSNGNTAPFSLGATLVIIYRVLSPDFPLTAIVLYDGAYAPSNSSSTMTQLLQGFYQPGFNPPFTSVAAKVTHMVANGQPNKSQTVSLNGTPLPSLYGNNVPPFPGLYNGSWDNPTWNVSAALNAPPNDPSETTTVMPASNNSGCVSWGGILFSTTVKDADFDGLLDYWEQPPPNPVNPNSAGSPPGYVDVGSGEFVALPDANPAQRDIFIQLDYMCSIVSGTCDAHSHKPSQQVLDMVSGAFSSEGRPHLHFDPVMHAIQEQTCTLADEDHITSPPTLCPFPSNVDPSQPPYQPGVVGWKGGFVFLKNEPLNTNPDGTTWTETQCEENPTTCVRRFQPGRKDSYLYIISGHALGVANWNLTSGTLTSVVVGSDGVATFTTSTPPVLDVNSVAGNGRVTISDAITSPNLNGTYFVTGVNNTTPPYTFTIQTVNVPAGQYDNNTHNTDPDLSVASGQAGTVSGFSDVGGADFAVTLGNWGPDGQTVNVQAGTYMHELGHTLALSHGGYFFPGAPLSYVPTVEANCKPNFQSVMNYLFQFDLLGPSGVLDFSNQTISPIAESDPLTASVMASALYSTTSWYAPNQTVGTPAQQHCDGTPLLASDPPEYRLQGSTSSISWTANQDINYDGIPNNGTPSTLFNGYNDWAHVDLRQIGATGSLSAGGGSKIGGGGGTKIGGGGGTKIGGGGGTKIGGGGGTKIGGGGGTKIGGGGVGNAEITHQVANSVVRPPRTLTAILILTPPRYIQLNWMAPTFGTIAFYKLYKEVNGIPDPASPIQVTGTSYPDQSVFCGPTYRYFVTANLLDGRESVPSNSVSLTACVPPYTFTGFYSPMATADPPNTGSYSGTFNKSKSITAKWTLKDSNGNLVTNVNVNTLRAIGPFQPINGTCPTTQASGASTLLFSPTGGAKGNSTLRFSSSQFVFNWDTKATPPSPTLGPCYVLELSLDSGQPAEKTGVKLQ